MHIKQRTLARSVEISGVGVHSGKKVSLVIRPAQINHGIRFKRVDLKESPSIPAHFSMVVDTSLATVIGYNGFIVSTIEHLMASFVGMGIDNALVEIDSHEVPIMDGSASVFTDHLKCAGYKEQEAPRCVFRVKEPICLEEDDKSVCVYPAPIFKITCQIEFSHPMIGRQSIEIDLDETIFEKEISNARTFGFLKEYETLKRYGLGQGSSLENAVVVGDNRVLNEGGLRFKDEFVRHKALDTLGDFALIGMPIMGHIVTHKSGHSFNHQFLKKFFSSKTAWETHTLREAEDLTRIQTKSVAM
jgi:UDP-3-O-[3-hydroxymyristoyl] N-acetylglucosamine deacetylase